MVRCEGRGGEEGVDRHQSVVSCTALELAATDMTRSRMFFSCAATLHVIMFLCVFVCFLFVPSKSWTYKTY